MTTLSFRVLGVPVPQGSKRGFVNKRTGRVNMVDANKQTAPWRDKVTTAATTARYHAQHEPFTGPVTIEAHFFFPRPKNHYRTGRNAHLLRDDAPDYVAVKPDLDKLQRAILDSLTDAAVFRDDSQAVEITASKTYTCEGEPPGVHLVIAPIHTAPPREITDTLPTQGALL